MNKRNTIIASIILGVLVLALLGKGCRRTGHCSFFRSSVTEVNDLQRDANPLSGFDDALTDSMEYPIVFHYDKPQTFDEGKSLAMNHIVGLKWDILDQCPPMPDSLQSIHVYVKGRRNSTKYINLWFYGKVSMNREVEYRFTRPVHDSLGVHVLTDSGVMGTELHWKVYGSEAQKDFRKKAEIKMVHQLEEQLIKKVAESGR